jgi:hypothetical protein
VQDIAKSAKPCKIKEEEDRDDKDYVLARKLLVNKRMTGEGGIS